MTQKNTRFFKSYHFGREVTISESVIKFAEEQVDRFAIP